LMTGLFAGSWPPEKPFFCLSCSGASYSGPLTMQARKTPKAPSANLKGPPPLLEPRARWWPGVGATNLPGPRKFPLQTPKGRWAPPRRGLKRRGKGLSKLPRQGARKAEGYGPNHFDRKCFSRNPGHGSLHPFKGADFPAGNYSAGNKWPNYGGRPPALFGPCQAGLTPCRRACGTKKTPGKLTTCRGVLAGGLGGQEDRQGQGHLVASKILARQRVGINRWQRGMGWDVP